ncbi:uncharacterized protein BJ171DRAFT_604750 [Polychytrium aggregatum]|uniref:uncharacterized protein n=1 Tax=Polychytrium aggregatum TaxID=110093 RepID=UPI0022FE0D0C|nr:uncharacterized protein BJ171DRAFT_604750 [Polychytrium aggregatum]KAI9193177.1 hypothetical protein BJ171DRAFT_604750 [Polychytrium aggregatum]
MKSILVLSSVVALAAAGTIDITKYPPLDQQAPPIPGINASYDFSKVPAIPVKGWNAAGGYAICPSTADAISWCSLPCAQGSGCDATRKDIISSCPTKGDWAMTFDDGPSNNTVPLLDLLDKLNLKATFCLVGSRVVERPDLVQRMFDSGHQLCVHTWSHRVLPTMTSDVVISELEYCARAIQDITGTRPTYMRPPTGDTDDRVRGISAAMGFKTLLWDHDTFDWEGVSLYPNALWPQWIQNNFTQWIKDPSLTKGPISLEHDVYTMPAAAALLTVPLVNQAGFKIKTAGECLSDMRVYQNQSYLLPPSGVAGGKLTVSTASASSAPAPGASATAGANKPSSSSRIAPASFVAAIVAAVAALVF